jgi:hypothetical protein
VLEEKTGEPMSARALLAYFAPLYDWLREQNQGHDCSFR